MAEPNTGGVLRTSLQEMEIGDYIKLQANVFLEDIYIKNGVDSSPELPFTGSGYQQYSNTRIGNFYAIKVDKGLLIADRVIAHSISWDALNGLELIQGRYGHVVEDIGGVSKLSIMTRSLGGGNAYADANGKSSTNYHDGNIFGAWPVDNEWEEYIVRKDYGGDGPGADDIWHTNVGVRTLCQDTPIPFFGGGRRVARGNTLITFDTPMSSFISSSYGFRPVFEFHEGGDN